MPLAPNGGRLRARELFLTSVRLASREDWHERQVSPTTAPASPSHVLQSDPVIPVPILKGPSHHGYCQNKQCAGKRILVGGGIRLRTVAVHSLGIEKLWLCKVCDWIVYFAYVDSTHG